MVKRQRLIAVGMVLFCMQFVLFLPSQAIDDVELGWKNPDIGAQVWQQLPGTGNLWGQPPSTGIIEPFIYEYKLACSGADQAIFPVCSGALPSCTESEDGTAVYWYRALKGATPPLWLFDSGPTCIYSEKPIDILAEIAAQISHEFKKSPVQAATVGSQPGPHTLRGNETNFYANAEEQEFNITLLGQKVHITATPVAYTWDYGDGNSLGPSPSSGFPLPDDRVGEQTNTSHVYIATGKYAIAVTTHFNGTYDVNGGPTLPIPEQGHITSGPLGLTVWRAITRNYADDCNTNPDGEGC